MKKVLVSFANRAMSGGFRRLESQAKSFKIFDKIHLYTERNLDKAFRKQFKERLIPGTRGYGYWVWKPQVILQVLSKLNEGDILLYMDVGSHLNIGGKKRLLEYFDLVEKSETGILAFRSPNHLDSKFTKMDVFDYLGVADNEFFTHTTQIEAGHIIIRKCEKSVAIIEEWLQVFCDNFDLATDKPSILSNFPNFQSARHDQGIFSILGKKYNITTLSTDETWSTDWSTMVNYPFQARRDKVYRKKYNERIISFMKRGFFFIRKKLFKR